MSYFNHAFKKTFVATKDTQAHDATHAGVTDGILVETGVHVSELKNTASPYQLGPGVVGLFDSKTNLSTNGTAIAADCCPFYIGAASIKLNDKQGPFHGGYQESNKSKVINPKYLRKMWKIDGTAGSRAVLEIGGTPSNGGLGTVLTFDAGTLVHGTGYAAGTYATTGGTGTGLTVTITVDGAFEVTGVTVANPGIGYTVGDTITIASGGADATIDTLTVNTVNACAKEFMCGESYYLRIDVKGTASLRFAHHNIYRTLQADGGCCTDPAVPTAVDPATIYAQWADKIATDPYLVSMVRAFLVIDGVTYAQDAATAVAEGLAASQIFANAPAVSTTDAGLVLVGAYVDTKFGDCTFQVSDNYLIEPLQLYASETDLTGDPCTFETLCVTEMCPGVQPNGVGEQKVRDLILSESYLQNFVATDLRIREITQGTAAYTILSRTGIYSSFFMLHSVPRFNNPSGTFDNDQYLLEVVGSAAMVTTLEAELQELIDGGCLGCNEVEDYTGVTCSYTLPGR